ncbi:competence protein ComK [bacterium]|nr:competence protein ComK [bacterium]
MNYILRKGNKVELDGEPLNTTFYKYLTHLSMSYFKSIDAMRKATKTYCNIKSEMPMYLSKEILLMYSGNLQSDDIILINYFSIKDTIIYIDKTTFIFKDETKLTISMSEYRVKRMIKNAKKLYSYVLENNI